MCIGMLVGAAGLAGLALADRSTGYALLVGPLVAAGLGMSTTMPAATAAVVSAAPPGRAGVAAGVLTASRQVGGAIGVALLGAFVAHQARFVPGLRIALLTAAAAFVAGGALSTMVGRPSDAAPSLTAG